MSDDKEPEWRRAIRETEEKDKPTAKYYDFDVERNRKRKEKEKRELEAWHAGNKIKHDDDSVIHEREGA